MPFRVSGGTTTSQSFTEELFHLKITPAIDFGVVVSAGTVNLEAYDNAAPNTTEYHVVVGSSTSPAPVPGSTVENIVRIITSKCSVMQIGMTGLPRVTQLSVAVNAHNCAWLTSLGVFDTASLQTAIQALGVLTVPAVSGTTDNPTTSPATENIDLSSVTVELVPYQLV